MVVEVIDHDLGFQADGVVVAFDVAPELLFGPRRVEFRIVLDLLHQPVVALDRGVGAQDIEDEALLDRLLHRVGVEGNVFHLAVGVGWQRRSKKLEGLVLRGRGESEVAGVGQEPAGLDPLLDRIVDLVLGIGLAERLAHGGGRLAALAAVGFVDDDGEVLAGSLAFELVEDEREFLDRGDDDLLALGDELPQVAGALGVPDGRADLHELPDGLLELVVKDSAVSDHDHRVEDLLLRVADPHQLVGQPGDGVRFTGAGGLLDQVALANTIILHVSEDLPDHAELVVAGENLNQLLLAGLRVLHLHDLGVVLQDVGEACRGEHLLPQVVGLQSVRVGWITRAIVPALVEGEEPRGLALELRAHPDLRVIHREVDRAAAELEQLFPRIPVALILGDRVADRLLGQAVFQLEGGQRQPVDEGPEVQRALGLIQAVAELTGDAEAVEGEPLRGSFIAGGRGAVEEVEVQRTIVDPVPQDIDHPAPADLGGEAGQEFLAAAVPRVAVIPDGQLLQLFRLGGFEKGEQLDHVEGVSPVVVSRTPGDPATATGLSSGDFRGGFPHRAGSAGEYPVAAGQVADDERFEAFFRGVGGHGNQQPRVSRSRDAKAGTLFPR